MVRRHGRPARPGRAVPVARPGRRDGQARARARRQLYEHGPRRRRAVVRRLGRHNRRRRQRARACIARGRRRRHPAAHRGRVRHGAQQRHDQVQRAGEGVRGRAREHHARSRRHPPRAGQSWRPARRHVHRPLWERRLCRQRVGHDLDHAVPDRGRGRKPPGRRRRRGGPSPCRRPGARADLGRRAECDEHTRKVQRARVGARAGVL